MKLCMIQPFTDGIEHLRMQRCHIWQFCTGSGNFVPDLVRFGFSILLTEILSILVQILHELKI